MRALWNCVSIGWCGMFHPEPSWPSNGHYHCPPVSVSIPCHGKRTVTSFREGPSKQTRVALTESSAYWLSKRSGLVEIRGAG